MAETQANAPDVITLRGRIIGMWECGKSSRDIAHMTGVSVRTVNRWINRWREEGSVKTKPRSGRPKVTSRDDVARILDTIHERPKTNTVQVARDLQLQCHPRTIRRRLKENKINCYVPAKETLSQQHREVRLGFALQYLAVDPDFWKNVIFTDEKCFSSVEAGARICWRHVNTRYTPKHIQERSRSGRITANLWGWMWAYGPGELVKIEGRFTGQDYITILEAVLLPTVRSMDVGDDVSCDGIVRKAQEVWGSVRRLPNICYNLVESLPKRLGEVIDAEGGWTMH
ncbi:hypothetical protein Pcinc_003716 [Petrolisthes cinctipes]|uniref:Transposase Tc1-like domain-containing protein n=1 Tax=Petrolisthes cinctipes TaxID=88211 RepID=A0AAE1GGA1_PETCI|nr:hypothetical protein Pcinc_003716 [Petrolisthes cinctipes]